MTRDDGAEENEGVDVAGTGAGRILSAPRRLAIMFPSRLRESKLGRSERLAGMVLKRF